MFSIEFLHTIREYEIDTISRHFAPGARILEIGGGTGYQAKLLADRGFAVTSIDVADSLYKDTRVFSVMEYDGKVFPFPDATFDVVFSSSVLEHIGDLMQLHGECRRVLKPDGYCVHIMPTAVWRFWGLVTHYYVELLPRWAGLFPGLVPRRLSRRELGCALETIRQMRRVAHDYGVVPRHGATGNALTELWTFSCRHWVNHFRQHNFEVILAEGMGLFYTGRMIFGQRWSLQSRARAASVLGSACILYKVTPRLPRRDA